MPPKKVRGLVGISLFHAAKDGLSELEEHVRVVSLGLRPGRLVNCQVRV